MINDCWNGDVSNPSGGVLWRNCIHRFLLPCDCWQYHYCVVSDARYVLHLIWAQLPFSLCVHQLNSPLQLVQTDVIQIWRLLTSVDGCMLTIHRGAPAIELRPLVTSHKLGACWRQQGQQTQAHLWFTGCKVLEHQHQVFTLTSNKYGTCRRQ